MIRLILSEMDFEYELRALVCSFFPECYCETKLLPPEEILDGVGEADGKRQTLPEDLDVGIVLGRERICVTVCAGLCERQGCVEGLDKSQDWHKLEGKRKHPYRTEYKNRLKRLVFELLSEFPQDRLPQGMEKSIPVWGTMTGVRPTKIVMNALLSGKDEQKVQQMLLAEYCCSPQRAQLGLEIAQREISLLRQKDYQGKYSLYVGIPFCPTTCLYCSFPSYPLGRFGGLVDAYLHALEKEIAATAELAGHEGISSVYIGGGTPTALTAEQLRRLFDSLRRHFQVGDGCEFTVEAGRPDSITKEKLSVMREFGVNRISVNPQTMQQRTLELIGREHTVAQTRDTFFMAREMGFDNINMDLIVGLPGESPADFADTLSQVKELLPDSLTIHSLVIKRGSALRTLMEEQGGSVKNAAPQKRAREMEKMMNAALGFAEKNGYLPYYMYRQKNAAGHSGSSGQENIGFARLGKESLYNIFIMEEIQTIFAVGAGASTKLYHKELGQVSRIENVKSVTDYIDRIEEMIHRKTACLYPCEN